MTSRERVNTAIAHRQPDRTPYCISFTPDGAAILQKAIGQADIHTFLDNDVVQVFPPWWQWYNLAPEWKAFDPPVTPPSVAGTGSYPDFFKQIETIRGETGKYILAMVYGSHFEKAYFSRGIENFLADLAGDIDFAQKLLNRIIEKNLVMLENICARPEIDGVLLGSDWGTQLDLIMSPDTWQNLIRPGEQREYDLLKSYGKHVWIHSCGCIEKIIPSLIEMGVDVLNPVQPEAMDIARLKARYGNRLTFWGGLSTQKTLPYGTPEAVRAESRAVRKLMGTGGGYIFAPAQEIQSDVPAANMLALIESAKEN